MDSSRSVGNASMNCGRRSLSWTGDRSYWTKGQGALSAPLPDWCDSSQHWLVPTSASYQVNSSREPMTDVDSSAMIANQEGAGWHRNFPAWACLVSLIAYFVFDIGIRNAFRQFATGVVKALGALGW